MGKEFDPGYGTRATTLDVLENVLGTAPRPGELVKLPLTKLDDLKGHLVELWSSQQDQPAETDTYLVGDWIHASWSEPVFRSDLSDALLYYPRLLVLDPLADFFGDRSLLPPLTRIRYPRADGQNNTVESGAAIWSRSGSFDELRGSPSEAASRLDSIVAKMYALEPLIRSGIIVMRDQWQTIKRRGPQLAASVRNDLKSPEMQAIARLDRGALDAISVWDTLRGGQVRLGGKAREADERRQTEPEFFYLAKTLAVADAADAKYAPSSQGDLELLRAKVGNALHQKHPGALLREVSRIATPSLDIPITRAIELRTSSQAFEDWRIGLSKLQRQVAAASHDELGELVREEMKPRIHAVERETRASSLADFRTHGSELVVSGAGGIMSGAASGQATTGVLTGVGVGVLQWIVRAYVRDRPSGADAVLASIIRGH